MKITFVTHVELVQFDDQPENEATFRLVNAAEAQYAILPSIEYRALVNVAADERIARAAAETSKHISASPWRM